MALEELDKINGNFCLKSKKKKKERLDKLKKLCIDKTTLDSAIDISKHESTIHLPLLMFFLALSLSPLNGLPSYLVYLSMGYILNNGKLWTDAYYDLLEIRINREGGRTLFDPPV